MQICYNGDIVFMGGYIHGHLCVGYGCGASELLEQGFALERVEAFVDSFPMGDIFLEKTVILPEQLDVSDCDLLIIPARHAAASPSGWIPYPAGKGNCP